MNILVVPCTFGITKPVGGATNRTSHLIQELKKRNNTIIALEPRNYVDPSDKELAKIYTYKDRKIFGRGLSFHRDFSVEFLFG